MLDELVDEGELERQQRARSRREKSNSDVDFVTITRNGTRAGEATIRMRIQPYTPQREIRLRASGARRLAEGANSRLALQRDRLTTNGSPIRDVTLEFLADVEEADGLAAVIRINATTSLVNFDYARPGNSSQPLIATMANAMDPETLQCASEISLGIGAADFHDRFVLMGSEFGHCNRAVNSREGPFIFADTVPQGLRRQVRDLHETVHTQLDRTPGNAPGIVFVIWRRDSPRNDFRLVRSLNRTSILVFNGPSWEQGFTMQQRAALSKGFAQEQIAAPFDAPAVE